MAFSSSSLSYNTQIDDEEQSEASEMFVISLVLLQKFFVITSFKSSRAEERNIYNSLSLTHLLELRADYVDAVGR